ncbi:MAG: hypothetical protein LBH57_01855, partial [Treponema sp.]|nr:hypothetical protein [Treponema sp.]
YTKYPGVYGVGSSGPRMGDAIWPEENFALVIWCDTEEARGIERAVAVVKAQFPSEGIKLFGIPEAGYAARITPVQAVYAPTAEGQAPRAWEIPDLPEDGPEDPNAE